MYISPVIVVALTTLVVVILVFGGVVLPAVWSRRTDRRCAAAEVLDEILRTTVNVVAMLRYQPGV